MTLTGTVCNGQIVFADPLPFSEGTVVEVQAKDEPKKTSLGERLLKHAATVDGLPEDFAEQHDHYLHGAPKR